MKIPFLTEGLGWLINFLYSFTHNYMWALLIFAVLIKLLLFPLGSKQQKSSVKQARLRPREMAIRKKYAGRTDKATQQKLNEEVMALYQQENFNPAAGCLPMLIQLPILYALYYVITNPIEFILKIPTEIINQLMDIAKKIQPSIYNQIDLINEIMKAPEKFAEKFAEINSVATVFTETQVQGLYDQFDFFGLNLLDIPHVAWPIILIPILTFVFAFLSTKIIRKFTYQPTVEGAPNMVMMDWMMPIMSVFISFKVSAAIGIYWIFQNVLGAVQQIALAKIYPIPQITEEQIKEAELQLKGKGKPAQVEKKVPQKKYIDKAPIKRSKKELEELSVERRKNGISPEIRIAYKSGKRFKARQKI